MQKYLPSLFLVILWQCTAWAQVRELNWEPLYSDSYISVEVKYMIPVTTICQGGNIPIRYKYRVKGRYRTSPYYLNWKMDYIDCKGDLNYRVNSLEIGKTDFADISNWTSVESMEWQLDSGTSIETTHYEEEASSSEKSGTGTKALQFSKDPEKIEGVKKIYMGETIELTVKGGALGIGAEWVWRQDSCDGKRLGRGRSLRFSPGDAVNVYVRAEGKNNKTRCARATIDVDKRSLAPSSISGRDNICKGETTTLSVSGGALGQGGTWVWYTGSCGGRKYGTGSSISVSPTDPTTYYVRAEGGLNTTTCASISVSVSTKSYDPVSITASAVNICEGQKLTLNVSGGRLSPDASWQWYANGCGGSSVGTGTSVSVYPNATTTYYVRGEGVCNNTTCVSELVNVERKLTTPGSILAPAVVYKGKRTKLSVPNATLPLGAEWRWYKGSCGGSGNYLGSGPSIIVRPRSTTTYFVKAIGKCNETGCAQTQITPLKGHTWNSKYTDRKKFFQIGWGIGAEFIQFHALTDYFVSSGSPSLDSTGISGFGIPVEIVMHPIFTDYFSLGVNGGASLGTTPYAIAGGEYTNSAGEATVEKYFYTRVNYGTELAFGFKKCKFLFNYNAVYQDNDFHCTIDHSTDPDETWDYTATTNQETIGLGLRFGQYLRSYGKGGNNYDLLYTLTRNTQDFFPNLEVYDLDKSVSGFRFSWWRHSRFKFNVDMMFPRAESSSFSLRDPSIQVSWILSRSRFF